MYNPVSSMKLDYCYKVLIAISTLIFIGIASGSFPRLPTIPSLKNSLGCIFLGFGEWRNHPVQQRVRFINGNAAKITSYPRNFNFTGTILCLLGLYLVYKGIGGLC